MRREQLEQERIAAEEAEQERQAELARQAGNEYFFCYEFSIFFTSLDGHFTTELKSVMSFHHDDMEAIQYSPISDISIL